MAFLSDSAKLNLADVRTRSDLTFHWCTSEPATRAAALSASVANKTSLTMTNGSDKITIDAQAGGTVTTDNADASHWAIVDGTELVAAGALVQTQRVYLTSTLSIAPAFDITPGSVTQA